MVVKIQSNSKYPLSRADFFLNNIYLGSTTDSPFGFSFFPNNTENIKEENELKVIIYDSVKNKGESSVFFKFGI